VPHSPTDVQRLTGVRVERRSDGVLLVDTANLSSERFPGTGSVAQAAVLLAVEMADRVIDPDRRRVKRLTAPAAAERQRQLVSQIDTGLPAATLVRLDVGEPAGDPGQVPAGDDQADADDLDKLPFITDSFLRTSTGEILARNETAFGAAWHADPDRLCREAVALLARFGAVLPLPGGVLVRPLVGRYRNTVATVKRRATTLF
jgi:hypothetical protein